MNDRRKRNRVSWKPTFTTTALILLVAASALAALAVAVLMAENVAFQSVRYEKDLKWINLHVDTGVPRFKITCYDSEWKPIFYSRRQP